MKGEEDEDDKNIGDQMKTNRAFTINHTNQGDTRLGVSRLTQ